MNSILWMREAGIGVGNSFVKGLKLVTQRQLMNIGYNKLSSMIYN